MPHIQQSLALEHNLTLGGEELKVTLFQTASSTADDSHRPIQVATTTPSLRRNDGPLKVGSARNFGLVGNAHIPRNSTQRTGFMSSIRSALVPLLVCATTALTGCGDHQTDQSKLCVFSNDAQAKKCKTGELAYFSPDSWGNEQLPLNVVAAYCNTNHAVHFNNAGVVCTFTDKRLWLFKNDGKGGS